MNNLVGHGPGSHLPQAKELANPICIRALGGLNNYNPGTRNIIDPPEPIFRIDVLIPSGETFEQRNITLACKRQVPPEGSKIGKVLWLFEPAGFSTGGVDGMRAISMLVDRKELVLKLRAFADEIEMINAQR